MINLNYFNENETFLILDMYKALKTNQMIYNNKLFGFTLNSKFNPTLFCLSEQLKNMPKR